jgi:hypothetical protein
MINNIPNFSAVALLKPKLGTTHWKIKFKIDFYDEWIGIGISQMDIVHGLNYALKDDHI